MTTQEEKMRRISILERAISERGWSLQIKRAMANEFGVTTRTIDRYREELIQGYQQEMSEDDLDFKRAEFIGRLRGHQRAALGSGRLGPLASMLNLEARISGLEQAESGQGSGQVQVLLNVPDVLKSETD